MLVIEGKLKQTTTTVLTTWTRVCVCTVCLCAFACVSMSGQPSVQTDICTVWIYVKLIQQSFPLDVKITVSMLEFP